MKNLALLLETPRLLKAQGTALKAATDSGLLCVPSPLREASLLDAVPLAESADERSLWARVKRWARLLGKAAFYGHLFFILCTSLLVLIYRFVDPPVTTLAAYRRSQGWQLAPQRGIELAQVPKSVRRMVVAVEDYRFYEHFGVDPAAILNAARINEEIGRPMYGGSTLTMQTARTLFLVPFKSYLRKYLELIVALELEILLPKDRILELYFQWAEWGKGVFGIQAASLRYYSAGVAKISLYSQMRLVALLSSPILYTPSTLEKSRILASRYRFLVNRYGS